MLEYLKAKKDVGFFTSLATLMTKCSVLNLEMFERQIKAEGLGKRLLILVILLGTGKRFGKDSRKERVLDN